MSAFGFPLAVLSWLLSVSLDVVVGVVLAWFRRGVFVHPTETSPIEFGLTGWKRCLSEPRYKYRTPVSLPAPDSLPDARMGEAHSVVRGLGGSGASASTPGLWGIAEI